eukprot:8529118-Alexandrium_andersonii.AAC.1
MRDAEQSNVEGPAVVHTGPAPHQEPERLDQPHPPEHGVGLNHEPREPDQAGPPRSTSSV